MYDSIPFPSVLRKFIADTNWTFAKTYAADWPHEYIVRDRVDESLFVQLVLHIRAHGYAGRFYDRPITYFDEQRLVYWTMGAPLDKTTIINRCRKEDSFESRRNNGTLPASNTAEATKDGTQPA